MIQIQFATTVNVVGGPTLALGGPGQFDSYTFASVTLDEATGAAESRTVELMPTAGTVDLLAIRVRAQPGQPATVTVVPTNGANSGEEVEVERALLVANPGVLAALVDGGPRSVTVKNLTAQPVDVDILAGRATA